MKDYEIDFEFMIPDGGTVVLPADDAEHAMDVVGPDYVKSIFPEATEIEISAVREVTHAV
jgi:hypothetical protein